MANEETEYREKYDKNENFNNFSEEDKSLFLQKKILKTGLKHPNPGIDFSYYDKIFIDLDSLLSRLISEELPADDKIRAELVSFIMELFADFFSNYSDEASIFILYGFKRNKIFDNVYENWNTERYKRFENETVVNFIHKNLLRRLKVYSKTVKNVTVLEYKDAFLIDVIKILDVVEKNAPTLLMSRNPQTLCVLAYYNISIYDGKEIVDRKTYKLIKGNPTVHYSLIPHWFLLKGDKRNGYKGYYRMGPKTTDKYIEKNKEDVISFEDERMKSLEKYKKLYFLKENL